MIDFKWLIYSRQLKPEKRKLKFEAKKVAKNLVSKKYVRKFALAIAIKNGSLAQLNRASDYGSEGYRFESCRNHEKRDEISSLFFLIINLLMDYGF